MPTKPDAPSPAAEPTQAQAQPNAHGPSHAGASGTAHDIVAGTAAHGVDLYVRALADDKESTVGQAARVLEEVADLKPELLAGHIERLIASLCGPQARASTCAAHVLPLVSRVAPAKVAKHLDGMLAAFDAGTETAQDGLVRTFVALCTASVTYQKKLISVLERALQRADDKTLARWAQLVLPALKGEPHAQARAVVDKRLADPGLPRPSAQRVADVLGIKLRPLPR
jgi:hypothetical protein